MFELESWSLGLPKVTKEIEKPKENKSKSKKRKSAATNIDDKPIDISKNITKSNKRSRPEKHFENKQPEKENDSKGNLFSTLSKDVKSSRFRWINEKLYTSKSHEALKMFRQEPDLFQIYHEGFKNQAQKWPVHPLQLIKKDLGSRNQSLIIADMGCGEAELARDLSSKHEIHSFDLVAGNKFITACDISHVPLVKDSVDVVIFCLSLMGTNLDDFLVEANRILRLGGELIIAEVESRVSNKSDFQGWVESHGFQVQGKSKTSKTLSKYFILEKYTKVKDGDFSTSINNKNRHLNNRNVLQPCLYKKR